MRWIVPVLAIWTFGSWMATPAFGQATPAPTTGVKIDGEYGYGMPPDISEHGWQMDRIINVLHVFMFLLFGGWAVFFVHTLMRYRQRPGHTAKYELLHAKPAKLVEVAVIIFEAVLLIGMSMPVWASVKNDLPTAADKPVRIRVIAEQFAWNFHYPGTDGVFGKTAPRFIDLALNPAGIDPEDPAGKDDLVQGQFHIPVNEKIICDISSKDVIHSFFLPVMRVKQDAIPGMRIPVWFKAREGTEGTYEVACAQLCGNNHYNMKALMVVESRSAFDAWYKKKKTVEEFTDE